MTPLIVTDNSNSNPDSNNNNDDKNTNTSNHGDADCPKPPIEVPPSPTKSSFLRRESTVGTTTSTASSEGSSSSASFENKHVSFEKIVIREYPFILGDHPSTTCGPPITIDWDVQSELELNVDDYESKAPKRRSGVELKMPSSVRTQYLLRHSDFTPQQLHRAAFESRKAQSQRKISYAMQDMEGFTVVLQSARRKLVRWSTRHKDKEPAAVWLEINQPVKKLEKPRPMMQQQRRATVSGGDPLQVSSQTVRTTLLLAEDEEASTDPSDDTEEGVAIAPPPTSMSSMSVASSTTTISSPPLLLQKSHSTGSLSHRTKPMTQLDAMRQKAAANKKFVAKVGM